MAVTGVSITGAVAGDDFDIERFVTGIPTGQLLAKAWLTLKTTATDPDISAIVQKSITTSLVSGQGQITDDGADGSGALLFTLSGTDTRAIGTAGTLFYDIQIKTDAAKIYTIELGTISVIAEVTLSTT